MTLTEAKLSPAVPDVHPGKHAVYMVMNAPVRRHPYEHMFIEGLFPSACYADMLRNLPPDDAYQSAANGRYPERGRVMLCGREGDDLDQLEASQRVFWADMRDRVLAEELPAALLRRFCPTLSSRLRRTCWVHAFLSRDRGGYAISPHTDTSRKLISVLVYLPTCDGAQGCGTSVCVSDLPAHNVFDTPHSGEWEGFELVWTAPFAPNAMFAFLVSDRSLHAVRPTPAGVVRDTLQFSVMMPG